MRDDEQANGVQIAAFHVGTREEDPIALGGYGKRCVEAACIYEVAGTRIERVIRGFFLWNGRHALFESEARRLLIRHS